MAIENDHSEERFDVRRWDESEEEEGAVIRKFNHSRVLRHKHKSKIMTNILIIHNTRRREDSRTLKKAEENNEFIKC